MRYRRMMTTIVALLAIVGSATAQSLTVQDIEAQAGEQATLVVSLSGATAMTALQFNLSLPEGVTLAGGGTGITIGAATNGHTLSLETLDGGDRMFAIYSMNLNTFGDGVLLRIPVTVGSNARSGTGCLYTVRIGDLDKVQGLDDIHLIGHITDEKFGHILVTRDNQEFELKAQGWNPL